MNQVLNTDSLRNKVREELSARHNEIVESLASKYAPGEPIEAALASLLPIIGNLFGVENPKDLAEVIEADLESRVWAIEEGVQSGWTASEIIRRTDILEDIEANVREGLPPDADRYTLAKVRREEADFNLQVHNARSADIEAVFAIKLRELCKILEWDLPATGRDFFLKLEQEGGPELFRGIIEAFKPLLASVQKPDWNPSFEELRDNVLTFFLI